MDTLVVDLIGHRRLHCFRTLLPHTTSHCLRRRLNAARLSGGHDFFDPTQTHFQHVLADRC